MPRKPLVHPQWRAADGDACDLMWNLQNVSMSEDKVGYKSNNNVVFSCKYPVAWCPEYRRDVLANGADDRFKEIIRQVCLETNSEVPEMEVMADQVHLLACVDPELGIHRLVSLGKLVRPVKLIKLVKGRSSRLLRQSFRWCRTRLPGLAGLGRRPTASHPGPPDPQKLEPPPDRGMMLT